MKLSEKEKCFGLNLLDFKPGNHVYLEGYHCEGTDFIVGCVGVNNKVISIYRPNNPDRKIEYIDMYKISIPDLFLSLSIYEDPGLTRLSQCVETVDEISIERNQTRYHYTFRLRDLIDPPVWLWQESCDIQRLKNGDKLVIHYFNEKNELDIRALEMSDFNYSRRYLCRRNAIMYHQFQWPGKEDIELYKSDVILTCKAHTENEGYDFKLGKSAVFGGCHEPLSYMFSLICGLQLVPFKK